MTILVWIFSNGWVVVPQDGTTWSGFSAFLCNNEVRLLLLPFFKESCDCGGLFTSWGTKGNSGKPEGLRERNLGTGKGTKEG